MISISQSGVNCNTFCNISSFYTMKININRCVHTIDIFMRYNSFKCYLKGGATVKVDISVRELIAFVMRSGSVDRPYATYSRLRQGTRLHKMVQQKGGEGYTPEVPLECDIEYGELLFTLSGRADGVISAGGAYVIDEIKSTSRPLSSVSPEDYPEYVAQAECYAYMLCMKHGLARVTVRITFVSTDTLETEAYDAVKTADELKMSVFALIESYYRFAVLEFEARERFVSSAHKLKFPYHVYRQGQKDIILGTFHAVRSKERLFVQAPTGLGKTLSVCYGAVKSVGEGGGRRIFYLTPKSTVGEAPDAAFSAMREHGLECRKIKLTAKEKCCFCKSSVQSCSSIECPYSYGHYDRINDALYALLSSCPDEVTKEKIDEIALSYKVCPYELSLDATLYCDVIICDCNYLFDPRVYLRRFFEEGCNTSENIALIDEAHDLVDRAREMYSAELSSRVYESIAAIIPDSDHILYSPLNRLCSCLASIRKKCRDNEFYDGEEKCGSILKKEPFEGVSEAARVFFTAAMEWINVNGENASEVPFSATNLEATVRDAAFAAKRFADMQKLADERFVHFAERRGKDTKVRLICIDPSKLLDIRMSRVRSAVLFSATLRPIEYFCDILGGKDAEAMELPSPFDSEQLFCGIMNRVSTRYADREYTLDAVIETIDTVVNARIGNYLVFLPSYEMLKKVALAYRRFDPSADIVVQKPDMTLDERKKFLSRFTDDSATVGFAVIGGMFGESIDLAGEKLIGTVIVGTGLARLNTDSNIIADYYAEKLEAGFEYAYLYPAMNKVLQAIGRVIRTEEDKGVCILIDDRFATPQYSRLLCGHIKGIRLIPGVEALYGALDEFWGEDDC